MSDEESHSESEFYYPEEDEQAKTEQNNMTNVATHGDENSSNSQEELQKFVQELGVMKTKIASLSKKPFFSGFDRGFVNMTSNDLLRAQADIEKRFPFFSAKKAM